MNHRQQPVRDRRIPVALATLAAVISVIAMLNSPGPMAGDSFQRVTATEAVALPAGSRAGPTGSP